MHKHVSVVLDWGLDENANYIPKRYGCIDCSETSEVAFTSESDAEHSHTQYVEGCFGCKIKTLEMSTGDANSSMIDNGWTQKKWDKELSLYRSARAQGIQPDGTSTAKIQKALDISDKTGHAYGSDL